MKNLKLFSLIILAFILFTSVLFTVLTLDYEENFHVESIINAPADKVWAGLTQPEVGELCHPFMRKNPSNNWGEIGGTDSIEYYSGLSLSRKIIKWEEGSRFDVMVIDENNGMKLKVEFHVIPIDNSKTRNKNIIHTDFLEKYPFPIRWALLEFKLIPTWTEYLEHVHKGVAYYIETGKPVKRNQFGSIPLFSPEIDN